MGKKQYSNPAIVYEHFKNCLQGQRETARNYTNRALTVFATGTAIVSIGLSFAFASMEITNIWTHALVKTFLILPTILYIMLIVFTYHATISRPLETLDNPNGLRDKLFYIDTERFYTEMIERIRKSFNKNQGVLDTKAYSVRALIILLPILAVTTAFAVAIFSAS